MHMHDDGLGWLIQCVRNDRVRSNPWMARMTIFLARACTIHRPAFAYSALAGALLACGIAGPALAQTGTNINPGSSTIVGYAKNDSLSFAVPAQITKALNIAATEVIARLNGGAAIFDVLVFSPFASAAVLATITSPPAVWGQCCRGPRCCPRG